MAAKKKPAKVTAAEKKARQKAAQQDREAKAKGAVTTALRDLAPMAKEVNVRLEKATRLTDDAYDHRLAAALQLDEAKTRCKAAKIPFEKWCTENLTQSYETVRKLAVVGAADDPVKALEDMRGKNKAANKKSRAKTAGKRAEKPAGPQGPKQTPADRIIEGFKHIKDDQGANLVKSQAERYGLKLVTQDAKPVSRDTTNPVTAIKTLFQAASAADKLAVLTWAAAEVGVQVVGDFSEPEAKTDEQLTEIPKGLRRERKAA
jgi:hypothetical protein